MTRGVSDATTQNRAERYRRAANKYADLAKHAEPYYGYVFMAEDLLKWSERRRELDVHALDDRRE